MRLANQRSAVRTRQLHTKHTRECGNLLVQNWMKLKLLMQSLMWHKEFSAKKQHLQYEVFS